ncbi:MAG: YoaK family protein, partial [Gammaproteobacteria bacterium]
HLGNVLPSAMTGNTALLGLALGQGRLRDAVPFIIAFGAFCGGTAVTTVALNLWRNACSSTRLASRLLAAEALLLAAFLLFWLLAGRPFGDGARDGLIVLAAFAMGMQGMVARLDNRPGVNTIVFTSTLSAIVGAATLALLRRPHHLAWDTKRQIGMFAAYFIGALISGLLVWSGSPAIAALPFALVFGALICRWRIATTG